MAKKNQKKSPKKEEPTLSLLPEAGEIDIVKTFENTICLTLSFSLPGTQRQVANDIVQTDADKRLVKLAKRVMDCPEFDAIMQLDGRARRHVERLSTSSPFRYGVYLIKLEGVKAIHEALKGFEHERKGLISKFSDVYEELKQEDKSRLGDLWLAKDYPPIDAVLEEFEMRWAWIDIGTSGKLQKISADIQQEEKAKATASWKATLEELRQSLRQGTASFLSDIIDQLNQANANGKPRKMREDTMERIERFFESALMQDVTNDTTISSLVTQAKAVMANVGLDAFQTDLDARRTVVQKFADLRMALEPHLVAVEKTPKKRDIRF